MNNLFVKKVCCLSSAFCRVSFRVFRKGYLFLAEDFQTWTFGSFVSRQKNIKSEKQSLFIYTVASTSSATKSSITRCLSLSKANSHFSSGCLSLPNILTSHLGVWACRKNIISIALKSVCSIEHLWCSFGNSKTQSFQQNLRELCVIKNSYKTITLLRNLITYPPLLPR